MGLLGGDTILRVLNKFANKPLHKVQGDVPRFKGKLRYVICKYIYRGESGAWSEVLILNTAWIHFIPLKDTLS